MIRQLQQKSGFRFSPPLKLLFLFLPLFLHLQLVAQTASSLPRSTPEAQGVSSKAILNFLEAAGKSRHEFHSFMILRHGKVVAEGWWKPYAADIRHTMYSVSKSFTATAVGFAVAEKKLSVEDNVISFFPEALPEKVDANLAKLRVRDLLSMSAGQHPDPTSKVVSQQNWVRAFLNIPVVNEPGSTFLYNSVATYMLSAIVQKVTGQKIFDYLQSRLFAPLGISGIDWETDGQGINVGGWGLRLKTEDMAKFGQLFLQGGKWRGKQILPPGWVEEATTLKIEQDPQAPKEKKDSSDWLQGYAYQMWRSRNNSYRGDGAFGQYIIVLPEKDAVIAITAETPDMQGEFNLIWQHLLPAFKSSTLPENPAVQKHLKEKIASLAVPLPVAKQSATAAKISGKRYAIEPGGKLQGVQLNFRNGICHLVLDTDSVSHDLSFGSGKWQPGQTTKYGPYLVAGAVANRTALPPFKVAGAYTWKEDNLLELTLRYVESPHTETIRCTLEGEALTVEFLSSFNPSRTTYRGSMRQKKAVAAKRKQPAKQDISQAKALLAVGTGD